MSRIIAVVGMGDMGSAVGRVLRHAGHRVITVLAGRSQATRSLAAAADVEDMASLEALLAECDLFLSILPPAAAAGLARDVARLLERQPRNIVYADCNAVAPATVSGIAAEILGSGVRFADVGIVGPPPKAGATLATRFYVSGAARNALLGLAVPEIRFIDMGDAVGRASAIKICYAAMNKGVDALYATVLLASRRLGVDRELLDEFAASQPGALERMERRIPFLAATADRYVGEMGEIAAGFVAADVSGDFHRGAEWLYALLSQSALAHETRASLPEQRSLDAALAAFEAVLSRPVAASD